MQQTSNYQLNQWDAEDRILRENFNNDNAKLDAALKQQADALTEEAAARENLTAEVAEKTSLHLIKSVRLSAPSTRLEVDLSDVDWSQWKAVHIYISTTGTGNFRMALGELSNTEVSLDGNFYGRLTLLPLYDPELSASGILFSSSAVFVDTSKKFREMTSFSVYTYNGEYSLDAGSALTVKGQQ
nr:hypothetical protein [uncultured Oscillibacter sp.]